MTGIALLLMVIQRDLGTATIFFILFATILYAASGQRRIILFSITGLLLAGFVGYLLFDVVQIRLEAWINPWQDPSGRSYQIVQALMAIANGDIFGRGIGLGNPSLVPIPHSDFIFSSIVEETGLIGALTLLLAIGLFTVRGFIIAFNATGVFKRLLAVGLTVFITAQSILIIGGNLRLLPLTGVTLPFVAYGGSSLVVSFICLGLLLIISSTGEEQSAPLLNPSPYLHLAGMLLFGLLMAALIASWWTVIRREDILSRTDNIRRSIAERYIPRGNFYDRNGNSLTTTDGKVGSFTRKLIYPDLSNIIGYTHPIYGQAGLESSLDPYLRGLRAIPNRIIEWQYLLTGYSPPGLDVRLSLDSVLQEEATKMLSGHHGAVLVLNADNGEILSIVSSPSFDANRLEENWDKLILDESTPLLNRASQGLYPPGAVLAPFILAETIERGLTLPRATVPEFTLAGKNYSCALKNENSSLGNFLISGCPGLSSSLGLKLGPVEVNNLFTNLQFFQVPDSFLPALSSPAPISLLDPNLAGLGEVALLSENMDPTSILISPLQLALAGAALSNGGSILPPRLTLAINTPTAGWIIYPQENSTRKIFTKDTVTKTLDLLALPGDGFWGTTTSNTDFNGKSVSWFLGGTTSEITHNNLVVVVLLEEYNPSLANEIGKTLLEDAGPGDGS